MVVVVLTIVVVVMMVVVFIVVVEDYALLVDVAEFLALVLARERA